jgi:hypothetical protein
MRYEVARVVLIQQLQNRPALVLLRTTTPYRGRPRRYFQCRYQCVDEAGIVL